jgi:hypothetical protein
MKKQIQRQTKPNQIKQSKTTKTTKTQPQEENTT